MLHGKLGEAYYFGLKRFRIAAGYFEKVIQAAQTLNFEELRTRYEQDLRDCRSQF
jgi:hypothetical protein